MTSFLLTALQQRLRGALDELNLLAPADGGDRLCHVGVHIGDLPPASSTASAFPHVVLRAMEGWQEAGEAAVRLELLCGIYNAETADAEGLDMDLAVLLSTVSRIVSEHVRQPLEGRFRLVADEKGRTCSWRREKTAPRPYSQAVMRTCWRMKGLE